MDSQGNRVNGNHCASPKDIIIKIDQDGQKGAFRTSPREDLGLSLERHQREGLIQDIMNAAMVGPHFLEQKLLSLYKSGDLDEGWCFPVPLCCRLSFRFC
jgi:hypothetical protein